ncbi:MAG TPA: DNA polymerase III subunit gamma/tau [Candidatus Hydrogenedens sp.]|nr:DNA polymerase III subunit gamma/tau [Candidatus Hydrogenedens sp.]
MPKPNDTYHVLARKWRPQQFDEVVGQEHITRTLKNAVVSGRIHHALLFIGSRGIGKTTTARILAKSLNCLSSDKPTPSPCDKCDNCIEIGNGTHLDVQEIDGASNNSVDNIREIREAVRLAPAHARYKVYIIDEVHQLSSAAFNALLKTLEEPPSHAVFILATTEAHKIPATIISRCQRYDFRRVAVPNIVHLLEQIVKAEKRSATREALFVISRTADGGVRDAESILDQLMTYCDGEITYKDVQDVLGLIETEKIDQLVYALQDKDVLKTLTIIDEISTSGKDLTQFVEEFIQHIRNLLILKTTQDPNQLFLPKEDIERLKEQSEKFSIVQLIRLVEQLAELNQHFTLQLSHRTALEAFFVKNCKVGAELSIETILDKILQLEDFLKLPSSTTVKESRQIYPQNVEMPEKKTIETPHPPKKDTEKPIVLTSNQSNISMDKKVSKQVSIHTSNQQKKSQEYLTKKLLHELSKEGIEIRLSLNSIQVSHQKETETLFVYVNSTNTTAISCLSDEKTQQLLRNIMNRLQYPTKNIQVIKEEYIPNPSQTQTQQSGNFKDLVSPDIAEELKKIPQIQSLLTQFRGRIVKVVANEEEVKKEDNADDKTEVEGKTDYFEGEND